LDVGPNYAKSIPELQRRIRERAAMFSPGDWLYASGYHDALLNEHRHPNSWDLDAATVNHPVVLTHQSRHVVVLNSRALSLLHVEREPNDQGGFWERTADGELTGVGYQITRSLLDGKLPEPSETETLKTLKGLDEELRRLGITAVQDATATNDLPSWETSARWKSEGRLAARIRMMVSAERVKEFIDAGLSFGVGDDALRIGPAKIVLEETAEGLTPSPEEFAELVELAARAGFPVAIHAVEEPALVLAAQVIAALPQELRRFRHRVEHAAIVPPWLLKMLREAGLTVVTHPGWVYWNGDRYLAEVPAHEQPWLYRLGAFWRSGVRVASSSDSPVSPWNPMAALYGAVSRRTASGAFINAKEELSVEQALASMTRLPAWAVGEEMRLGRIVQGALADFVVLDRDPTQVASPEELLDLRVLMTIVGGQPVWQDPQFAERVAQGRGGQQAYSDLP
jgi:predicted amidohydrolase YtcJ